MSLASPKGSAAATRVPLGGPATDVGKAAGELHAL